MANQYVSGSLGELVRVQGEQLARLTVLVEEDHRDLQELEHSVSIIAEAVARSKTLEQSADALKSRVLLIVIPLVSTLVGALAGHFIR